MTPAETVAWGALLDAISGHLTAPGPGPEQDVRLACAAIIGWGCGPDMVAKFTAELNARPGSTSWGGAHAGEIVPNHIDNTGTVVAAFHPGDCITCHGHVGPDGTFTPAVAS